MTILKCKMCGGELEIQPGETVAECIYCGTKQTVPLMDDDKKAAIYERANRLRANADFDRAFSVYEGIAQAYPTDAEAFWGELLCKYGIEYVDDPATGKKIPTCHRSSYTSILDDEAFTMVMENADPEARKIYREQAKQIEEIRKGIIEISSNEEPYDVFICYKETDENGERTQDSVLAQEVYDELTEKGYRVFFSRITLEDKLGEEYEPYIFAALNSAKVMLVFGTDYEYFNAPWVKNEWSRFLDLMAKGNKKYLIPCYKDIDAYDMPKEFQRLQSQDMSKIGWIQDLVRGVGKIVRPSIAANTNVQSNNTKSSEIEPLLQRAFIFLEDGNFMDADEYCEKVLDKDPTNARAYLGKLMAEMRVKKTEDLKNCSKSFENSKNYKKILRYGDRELIDTLKSNIVFINERNENERYTEIYKKASSQMENAQDEKSFKSAAEMFESILGFRDTVALSQTCRNKAEECRKNDIYKSAKAKMDKESVSDCEEALVLFQSISGWKDSDEQIITCSSKLESLKEEEKIRKKEKERQEEEQRIADEISAKRQKKIMIILGIIAIIAICFATILFKVIIPQNKYNEAINLMNSGDYESAYNMLKDLNFKDSSEKLGDPNIVKVAIKQSIKETEIGSTVVFGAYDQNDDSSDGKEEIEWIVLAKEDNKALLISKYSLSSRPFNSESKAVTWETCSVREWMNNEFMQEAFDEVQNSLILETTVTADKNPKCDTNQGNNTIDKVFLLSLVEAAKYFETDKSRITSTTSRADSEEKARAVRSNGCWHLRTMGVSTDYCVCVNDDGKIIEGGGTVIFPLGIRPALWINLSNQ